MIRCDCSKVGPVLISSRRIPKGLLLLVKCTSVVVNWQSHSAQNNGREVCLEKGFCLSSGFAAKQLLTCTMASWTIVLSSKCDPGQPMPSAAHSYCMMRLQVGSRYMTLPVSSFLTVFSVSYLLMKGHAVQIFWRDCGLGWRGLTHPGV